MPDGPAHSRDFGALVGELVRAIPAGRVMTYSDVAAVLGSRAPRAVGRTMALEGSTMPWWRVVRAGGHPPTGHAERARIEYEREGTPLREGVGEAGYRVDDARARWWPTS